jgi:hypothetical protein
MAATNTFNSVNR